MNKPRHDEAADIAASPREKDVFVVVNDEAVSDRVATAETGWAEFGWVYFR